MKEDHGAPQRMIFRLVFERHWGHWLAGLFLTICAVKASLASPGHQLHDIKNRIRQVQKDVQETESSRQKALNQLKLTNQAIALTTRKLRLLEQQQAVLERELGGLHQQTDATQGQLNRQQSNLALTVTQRYQSGFTMPWVEPSAEEVAIQIYLDELGLDQAAQVAASHAHIQTLSDMTQAHEHKVQALQNIAKEVQHQQARLKAENETKAQLVAQLSQRLDTQRQSLSALQRDAARLSQLMEKLARQAEERRARRHHLAPHPAEGSDNNSMGQIRETPEPGQDGSDFSRLRGKLRLPVAGELKNRFGSPRVDTGLKWSGVFIRSAAGQPVKAVASGRVVYAGWLRGFGNVLIIDHGAGYMSLYGGGEALRAHVDQAVERGAIVASTGNTGGMDESGLYFELRYQGKPFDPLTWVGHP